MANKDLTAARKAKADEFYTQRSDIDAELWHYSSHFCGKTVFCNCDDPLESNFFRYFALNFTEIGLKRLITTSYKGSPLVGKELWSQNEQSDEDERKAWKFDVRKVFDINGDGAIDNRDIVEILRRNADNELTPLRGDGDFRSRECEEILKNEADIVVTNPPFSLFRQYVAQLMKYNKKFIIIGNQNAITYREIFPLLKDNKIWLGYKAGDMAFKVPDYYEPRATRYWVDESGQKWRSMGNICWFTNLDISKRHEELKLGSEYYKHPENYPKYDNYDAINVNKVADIPCDYDGAMGVPVTFLDKYNPEQFEILGATESEGKGFSNGLWKKGSATQPMVAGKRLYKRIFIKRTNNGHQST